MLCLFQTLTFCGCRDQVLKKCVFYPPKPSYLLKPLDESELKKLKEPELIQKDKFSINQCSERHDQEARSEEIEKLISFSIKRCKFYYLTKQGIPDKTPLTSLDNMVINAYKLIDGSNELALYHIENKCSASNQVIIYSHGNSTDIGYLMDQMLTLSFNLKVNIIAYDYYGYGDSSSSPSDINIIQNVQLVYIFALSLYQWQNIVMHGQSLGSGPSTFIASNQNFPVGGLIIQSGFTSGLRIQFNNIKNTHNQDFFPNIEFIRFVNCPIYIIHGLKDNFIPINHAQELQKKAKNSIIWEVPEAGHNGIEEVEGQKLNYFQNLQAFLTNLTKQHKKYKSDPLTLRKANTADAWSDEIQHFYKTKFENPLFPMSKTPNMSEKPILLGPLEQIKQTQQSFEIHMKTESESQGFQQSLLNR